MGAVITFALAIVRYRRRKNASHDRTRE